MIISQEETVTDSEKEKFEIDQEENFSIFREFWDFLKHSKKWWLLPIVLIMVLLSVFIVLTESSAIFPMIYAIF